MMLFEKYRPRDFNGVIGQDKAVKKIKTVLRTGWGGDSFWIAGQSGTGKTTLAKIISTIGADDFFVMTYLGRKLSTTDIDNIERTMYLYGGKRGGRVFIINEAHGLRKNIIERFLDILESIPKHVIFIFTTTKIGQAKLFDEQDDASPLLSRCVYIELTNQGLAKKFAERAKEIAKAEELDGKPLAAYETLVKRERNNMRAVLEAVQAGEMME